MVDDHADRALRLEGMVSSLQDQLDVSRREVQRVNGELASKSESLFEERQQVATMQKESVRTKQELDELYEGIKSLEQKVRDKELANEELYAVISSRDDIIRQLKSDMTDQENSVVDMTSQLTEKMKSMKKNQEASELACANLEKTVAAMQEQMNKQADDAAALDALNKELQNQLVEAEKFVTSLQMEMEELVSGEIPRKEQALAETASSLHEMQDYNASLEREVVECRAECLSLQTELNRRAEAIELLEREANRRSKELAKLRKEMRDMVASQSSTATELTHRSHALESSKLHLNALHDTLSEREARHKVQVQELTVSRSRKEEECAAKLHRLQMELDRMRQSEAVLCQTTSLTERTLMAVESQVGRSHEAHKEALQGQTELKQQLFAAELEVQKKNQELVSALEQGLHKERELMNTVGELERACLHVQELEETVASKTRTMSEMKVTLDERIRRIGALEQESHHHQLLCDRNMQVVQQNSVDELHLEKQHSQAKVFELETQLQQATLQANYQADTVQKLEADLAKAKKRSLGAKRQMEESYTEIAAKDKQILESTTRLAEVERELDENRILVGTTKRELAGAHQQVATYEQELQRMRLEFDEALQELEAERNLTGSQLQDAKRQVQEMEEELQERVSHVAASSAQMNMAEMEVSKTSVHLAEALRQVGCMGTQLDQMTGELLTAKKQLDDKTSEMNAVHAQLEMVQRKLASFEDDISRQAAEMHKGNEARSALQRELALQNELNQKLGQEVSTQAAALKQAEEKLEQSDAKRLEARRQIHKLEKQNAKLAKDVQYKELELVRAGSEAKHLQEVSSHLEKQLGEGADTLTTLTAKLDKTFEQLARKREENKRLEAELEYQKQEVARLSSDLRDATDKLEAKTAVLEVQISEGNKRDADISSAQQQLTETEFCLRAVENDLEYARDQAKSLEEQLRIVQEELCTCEDRKQSVERQLEETGSWLRVMEGDMHHRDNSRHQEIADVEHKLGAVKVALADSAREWSDRLRGVETDWRERVKQVEQAWVKKMEDTEQVFTDNMRTTVDAVEAAWVEKLDTVEKAWIQNLTTAKHEHQQEVERLQERLKTQEDDALREGEARHRDWLNKEAAMQREMLGKIEEVQKAAKGAEEEARTKEAQLQKNVFDKAEQLQRESRLLVEQVKLESQKEIERLQSLITEYHTTFEVYGIKTNRAGSGMGGSERLMRPLRVPTPPPGMAGLRSAREADMRSYRGPLGS